jgi:hypothetical protein
MATTSKSEKIFIGIDDQVIELTGADKEAFLEQRAKDKAEADARKAELETRQAARLSALQKLGLTEEEINAIL